MSFGRDILDTEGKQTLFVIRHAIGEGGEGGSTHDCPKFRRCIKAIGIGSEKAPVKISRKPGKMVSDLAAQDMLQQRFGCSCVTRADSGKPSVVKAGKTSECLLAASRLSRFGRDNLHRPKHNRHTIYSSPKSYFTSSVPADRFSYNTVVLS